MGLTGFQFVLYFQLWAVLALDRSVENPTNWLISDCYLFQLRVSEVTQSGNCRVSFSRTTLSRKIRDNYLIALGPQKTAHIKSELKLLWLDVSFEHHVNEILKPRMTECMEIRDKIIEEQAEYLRLEEMVQKLKGKTNIKTKVDLGCNFFAQG